MIKKPRNKKTPKQIALDAQKAYEQTLVPAPEAAEADTNKPVDHKKNKSLPHIFQEQNPEFSEIPDVLLGYQKRVNKKMETANILFIEKSRRIGITWGIAADAAITAAASPAAGGMDVFYIGFNLEMTREFIDTCASWAKYFSQAVADVDDYVFSDDDEKTGETREIKAFRITFDSGFEIIALSSKPRSLRGRQGYVIIDEAAFHDGLEELMKAALALLMWGGKVLVISTHDGADNRFNQYIQDIRAGRLGYGIDRIDLDDALAEGLYQRICLVRGLEWSPTIEKEWRDKLVKDYGDAAEEELFCAPRAGGGTFLPGTLVESRMVDVPVLRFTCKDDFVFQPELERRNVTKDWLEEHVDPVLKTLDPKLMSFFGEDFGRSGDLSVFWILQMQQNTNRKTSFVVELSNVPFDQQKQIVFYIISKLPRFIHGAFDARGNGSQLAEETMQKFGQSRISCVMITTAWYLEALPKYKAAIEDGTMTLPRDADILADHRAAVFVKGVAQIPETRTKGKDGNKRHGDSLIAAAMAFWSTLQDIIEYAFDGMGEKRRTGELKQEEDDDLPPGRNRHFGGNKGAW